MRDCHGTKSAGESPEGGVAKNIGHDSAATLSASAERTVGAVVYEGNITDTPLNVIVGYPKEKPSPQGDRTFELCTKIIDAHLNVDPHG